MLSIGFWQPEMVNAANLRRIANGLAICLTVAYPFAVYFGLQVMEPRMLGLLLLVVILLRHWRFTERFLTGTRPLERAVFVALCGLALGIAASNREELLLLYPAAVSISLFLVFGATLLRPPSMIERIARLAEPDLPPQGVRYTRQVTWVWCGFFVLNSAVSLVTVFASRACWALYNGLISYLLMGLLFSIEWLVRGWIRRRPV
jgi:uncharacterized membrane protein